MSVFSYSILKYLEYLTTCLKHLIFRAYFVLAIAHVTNFNWCHILCHQCAGTVNDLKRTLKGIDAV